jgi:hypothetical protein
VFGLEYDGARQDDTTLATRTRYRSPIARAYQIVPADYPSANAHRLNVYLVAVMRLGSDSWLDNLSTSFSGNAPLTSPFFDLGSYVAGS